MQIGEFEVVEWMRDVVVAGQAVAVVAVVVVVNRDAAFDGSEYGVDDPGSPVPPQPAHGDRNRLAADARGERRVVRCGTVGQFLVVAA